MHIKSAKMDVFLDGIDDFQLFGKAQPFDTLVCVIRTAEQLQNLER